ncbi:MAG: hypothetical protein WCI04_06925 [archaeon]
MKYPQDTFYMSFAGAYKAKDNEITKDLIFNELGWLIAKKKKEVLAMLKEIGIKIGKRPSDTEIVKVIIDNKENRRLHIGIAYLITEKNKGLESSFLGDEKFSNAVDPKVTVGSDPVSAIAGAIGSVFSFATSFKDADTQKKVENSKLMQSVMAYKTAQLGAGSGSNTTLYVIGGVLVVGAIIAGVYFYSKSKSSVPQIKAV